jgi:hypothetical protein
MARCENIENAWTSRVNQSNSHPLALTDAHDSTRVGKIKIKTIHTSKNLVEDWQDKKKTLWQGRTMTLPSTLFSFKKWTSFLKMMMPF